MQCLVQHDCNASGFVKGKFEYCRVYIGIKILINQTKKFFVSFLFFNLLPIKVKREKT